MNNFDADFIRYLEEKLNLKIIGITKLTNGSYNKVFKLETDKGSLLLRIFSNKSWPENGKLEFINEQLIKRNILTAKILVIERESNFFDKGFMVQEFIEGYSVEDIIGEKISFNDYFKKLANVLRKVHSIEIQNSGYIGTGIASHKTLTDFMNYECDRLKNSKMINEKELNSCINIVIKTLSTLTDFPFVLCHSDISENNVMLNKSGELVLIDWDNAISSNWISDFSVMTFWMHFKYCLIDYKKYRETFLNEYKPQIESDKLDLIEKTYHLFQCLKLLNYYTDKQNTDRIMNYYLELVNTYN